MTKFKEITMGKTLYKKLIHNANAYPASNQLKKYADVYKSNNIKIYKEKKKLKEIGFGCPLNAGLIVRIYSFSFLMISAIFFYFMYSSFVLTYILLPLFFFGLLISLAVANHEKFKKSPLVNQSLFHKLFIGGTATKWFEYDVYLLNTLNMDCSYNEEAMPVNVFYIGFLHKTETDLNKVILSEISYEEYQLYCDYDFDSAGIGICDKDVVDILFYKEGAPYYEAIQKVS